MTNKNATLEQLQNAILMKRLQKQMKAQAASRAQVAIPLLERNAPLLLSHAQQRLWFLDQFDHSVGAAYHIPAALKLSGQLDKVALKRALDAIIARHEVLRTRFVNHGSTPEQVIDAADTGFQLSESSLAEVPQAEQAAAIERISLAEVRAPFDLASGPLIRGQLLELAAQEHILLLTQHHIISDGWSIGVLVREVNALYQAFSQNTPSSLPPLPIQYADYAAWQRSWLKGDVLQAQTEFWKNHLSGAPAVLDFPLDHPRPSQQSFRGGQHLITLSPALCQTLRSFCQQHETTLFMTLFCAWACLLSRLSGQKDLVIGTPVANRNRSETENLLGFFVNTLAMRVQVEDDPAVATLLARIKAHTLAAYEHQDLPFDQVVEALQPTRSMSYSPVFQTMLSLNNTPGGGALKLGDLDITPFDQVTGTTQFDLALALTDDGEILRGKITFASDLFEQASIERLASHFDTLLAAMLADDQLPVSRLPLMTAAQRAHVVQGFNAVDFAGDTATADGNGHFKQDVSINALFEAQVAQHPEAIALCFEQQQLSYARLNAHANQLAHHLIALGVGLNDRVALCVERGPDMIIAILAILKAGAGYVPLDPAYPQDRIAYTLGDCGAKVLLTHSALQESLPQTEVPRLLLDQAQAMLAELPQHNPALATATADGSTAPNSHLAYIIYTSGSTGMPKGVMVEHRNVARLFSATDHWYHFNQNDVWTLFHSFAFDFSVWEIWGALLYGGRLVIVPYLTSRSPGEFYQLLCNEGVTVLNQTPSAFRQLIAAQGDHARQHALRHVIFGGEALELAALQPWYARSMNAATVLVNMYGITETTVHVTYRPLTPKDAQSGVSSPIGRQIPDLQIYILDPHGEPVPIGVTGELFVGGDGVTRGYLNRPELNAERFIPDPFAIGNGSARLYKTGDLGRWLANGQIDYLGRNDFQVKIRGFRIELGEIEARLAACHGVREAVVLAREDEGSDKRLVAYVVPKEGIDVSAALLREQLRNHLADYMIPAAFIMMEALPLTANGKLDSRALPAPDASAFAARDYQAPQGELETTLCSIWCEVLRLDKIGVNDNFFEIGGDSIRSISIVAKAREQQIALAIVDIFKCPTIATLAHLIDSRQAHTSDTLTVSILRDEDRAKLPAGIEDAYALTMLQMGMVVDNQRDQEYGLYHEMVSTGLELPDWQPEVMQTVLDAMCRKHPILRTSFDLHNYSEPLQLVHKVAHIKMHITDISHLDSAAQETAIAAFVDGERKTGFDFATAPLLRIFIHVRGPRTIQYTLSGHHAILDGWTLASMQTELFNLYVTLLKSGAKTVELTPLAVTPRLIALRERQALQSDVHKNFWRNYLDDYIFTELPRPEGHFDSTEMIRNDRINLQGPLVHKLQNLMTELAVPMRTLLLAAHVRMLSLLSGKNDITTGLVGNVRPEETDGDKVLGLFLNTLPFRFKLPQGSWKDLIRAIFHNELDVIGHRHYPYFQLYVENGRQPLYQTHFNYTNFHVYENLDAGFKTTGNAHAFEGTGENMVVDCSWNAKKGIDIRVEVREFSVAQAQRMLGYFVASLQAMADNADARHERCNLLSPAEQAQLAQFACPKTLTASHLPPLAHQLFEQQVEKSPDAIALVHGDTALSYAELNRRANRLAHHLRGTGVKPDQRVAICLERNEAMVIAILGVLKAGAAYVPLDPNYPSDRIAHMLQDSTPHAVISQRNLARDLPAHTAPDVLLDDPAVQASMAALPGCEANPQVPHLSGDNLMYTIYTSGSTGLPKGVMIEHRNLINLVVNHVDTCQTTPADRVLQFASFSFDASVSDLFATFLAGATLVLRPAHIVTPDASFIEFLDHHRITYSDLPVAFWHQWTQEIDAGRSRLGNHFRLAIVGGEKAEYRNLVNWFKHPATRHCRWLNTYGPTETTVHCTEIAYDAASMPRDGFIPIGRPVANARAYILDANLLPVPQGVPGEIHIGGPGVGRGYLNQSGLTEERFLPDPFSSVAHAHMYKTGDLGRWLPDGTIEYLGRNDFQVKIRGFRVELGEIESCLTHCNGVGEALVMARSDNPDNPSDKRLVAYLTAKPGHKPTAAGLRAELAEKLADHMLPAAFVILDAFPINTSGKIERKALPAPDQDALATRAYEAPVNDAEAIIAEIWAELLGLDQVSRNDNFFELGGHSLMVISLIEYLRQEGWSADARTIFTAPTVAQLAARLEAGAGEGEAAPAAVEVPPNLIVEGVASITPDMLPLVKLAQSDIDGIVARIPGGVANIKDIYPLSPLQTGILFHHMLETEGDTYLLRQSLTFDTRTRLDRFLATMQQVINRHDILKSCVLWTDLPQPVQVVVRHAPLPLHTLVLNPDEDGMAQMMRQVDPRHMRLPLQHAPLMSCHIGQDPKSGEWHLLILSHHMVGDHVTQDIIVMEVNAILQGRADSLQEPLPYRNFIAQTIGIDPAAQEAYFRDRLGDIDEPTAPFGLLDVRGDGQQGREILHELPADTGTRIVALARAHGVTPAVLFHVAWAQVIARCTGKSDVVFGTVLFGRMAGTEGADQVLGMFINTLPVRIGVGKAGNEVALKQALDMTYTQLTDLLTHEQASLALAQRASGVAAPMPLFTTLLNYRHIHEKAAAQDDAAWEGIRIGVNEERINYPIGIAVNDFGDRFSLSVQCDAVDPQRIAEMLATAMQQLVDTLETDPARPLHNLEILPAAERQQVLYDFNATDTAYPQGERMQDLFEAQALKQPDAIALVFENQSMTYDQLNRRANQLAHRLIELGAKPDERVAVCMERSLEMVIALLAILKAGAAYVPLDPAYPVDRLAYMLDDSSPLALLTQQHLRTNLPETPVTTLVLDDASQLLALANLAQTNPAVDGLCASHLAYVIYTSGSTGLPKGVMNEHRAVINCMYWMQQTYPLTAQDKVLQKTPFSFDVAGWEFWCSLLFGAQLVIARPEGHKSPEYLEQVIAQHGITTLHFVPTMLQTFIETCPQWRKDSVKQVFCIGEALPPNLRQRFARNAPGIALHNMYGPTEAAIGVTWFPCAGDAWPELVPIGKPYANTAMYILDENNLPLPIGVAGELHIGGVQVARGYFRREQLSAERFIANPFRAPSAQEPAPRMYKTGDLARWLPDGNIDYLGRNDFQLKIRGYRIELGEIEARLAACEGVREAVVVAREDVPGDQRLVAYLIARDGVELEIATLRAELAKHLADYMLPNAFVMLAEFPLSTNGKLDRKALPAPDASSLAARAYEAPQGELESAIARIWQELLGVPQVGRHDHFFELGGHSLIAVQLVSRMRQDLELNVSLRDLFAHATLAGFASHAGASGNAASSKIGVADRSAPLPLSFAQQRLWFLDQLDHAASAAYHMPAMLRLTGQLDVAALQATLARIVARHENLRTTFVMQNGQPLQVIKGADCGFDLQQTSLEHLAATAGVNTGISIVSGTDPAHQHPAQAQAQALQQLVHSEVSRLFELDLGPLIRGHLIRLGADEHILLIVQHHIISDGWSIGVLVREVSTLYAAFVQQQPDPLPPLALQYADYAAWQRNWLSGNELDRQSTFWKQHLVGAPSLLDLPLDRPRPAKQSVEGASHHFTLDAATSAQLQQLGQQHGCTLFMTLLAAWASLLARISGQQDVVIGTPVANRQRPEIEALAGFFVNTLALRVDLSAPDLTVAQLLTQVQASTLAAYEHQDLPFEQMVEALQPVRSTSYSPVFQSMFSVNSKGGMGGKLQLPGLTIEGIEPENTTSQFDLSCSLTETADGLQGTLSFATALFEHASVARFAQQFTTLLQGMLQADTPIARLPLLGQAERTQLLQGFNATGCDFAQDFSPAVAQGQLLQHLFEAQVAARPNAIALEMDEQQLTYAELNTRANRLAHRLLEMGITPDQRVALCVTRSVEMIVGILAVFKAGAAYVPLDPQYPPERLAYMLADSNPVALLTQSHLQDSINAICQANAASSSNIPRLLLDDDSVSAGYNDANVQLPQLSPENLAYVIYTSGSTGQPKGVMNHHLGLCNLTRSLIKAYRVQQDSRILQFVSISFDVCISEITQALCSGATLVLASAEQLLPGEPLQTMLQQARISHISLPMAVLATLPEEAELPDLQALIVGGEALPPALAANWGTRVRLYNSYGPTETTVCTSIFEWQDGQYSSVPIGRPTANTQIHILDAHGQPQPIGVTGEIHIGGVQVARGYLGKPDMTAERFIADPFAAVGSARLYKTGDLGRWLPDGNIEYRGRNDLQVKIRGFRIELGEIETRLAALDGVREAAVLVQESVPGDKRLVGYVIAEAGVDLNVANLKSELATSLAEHMVPSGILVMDAFPLTPNGKLDRKALPVVEVVRSETEFVAPRDETEAILSRAWADILNLAEVGVNDNFFDLGGHSLLIVKLHALVGPQFPERLTIADYFKYTTIAKMAEFLASDPQDSAAQSRLPGSASRAEMRKNKLAAQKTARNRRG